jgi:outer membrane protein assembly factor BamB
MINMKSTFLFFFILLTCYLSFPQEAAQWRGPNRDGKYPDKNLLREWPAEGPEMLWSFGKLGAGMGSAVIANEKVYVTGIPDTVVSMGRLFVFDLKGKLLWTKDYGTDFTALFAGARSTPTIEGDKIYIERGNGKIYCFNANSGDSIWAVDFFKDLQADSVQFGFSESPLVDGDRIYVTPGGKTNNMVCLNRFTGEKIWASKGFAEQATYTSPIIFNHNGRKIIVNLTASSILGIDAGNGELLWRFFQFQDNKIHANTPLYIDGKVLIASTSRKDSSGLVMLQLSRDGKEARVLWRNKEVINFSGGTILKDSLLYLPTYMQPKWFCVDPLTGKVRYTSKELGGGVVIYADGLFYCYTERNGEMALVNATPEAFTVISKFKVPMGNTYHWAHPVISHGRLFVRHGEALMVYDIGEKR